MPPVPAYPRRYLARNGTVSRWIAVAMGLGALLAACGQAALPTPTLSPSPTPFAESAQEVLERARLAAADLRSLHFQMTLFGGTVPLIAGFSFDQIEGDMARPDRWQAELRLPVEGRLVPALLVGEAGRTYITHPATGQWIRYVTEVDPPRFFHPTGGIQAVLAGVVSPVRLPDERLEGSDAYHIRGVSRASDFQFMAGASVAGARVRVDLWIDKGSTLLRRVRLEGRIAEEDSPTIVRLIRLSQFNRPVTIELPNLE